MYYTPFTDWCSEKCSTMYLYKRTSNFYYLAYNDPVTNVIRRVSTGTKLKKEANAFMRSFTPVSTEPEIFPTAGAFFDEFIVHAQKNLKTQTLNIYKYAFNHFNVLFPNIAIRDVNAYHYDKYKSTRALTHALITVNIELRSLRAAFATAVRWHMIPHHPFLDCKLFRIPTTSPAFMSREQFRTLVRAADDLWFKQILFTTVMTGMRLAEVTLLTWNRVNLEKRLLYVHSSGMFNAKGDGKRIIPLNSTITSLLKHIRARNNSEYVFALPSTGKQPSVDFVSHKFHKTLLKTTLDRKLHFHSLRHTFASWLVQDGISLYEVQKLLGHSSSRVTEIYAHLLPETRHDTVEVVSLKR